MSKRSLLKINLALASAIAALLAITCTAVAEPEQTVISTRNITKYENLLLPNLPDFISTFNLELKTEDGPLAQQDTEPEQETDKETISRWLRAEHLPVFTEIDQDISTSDKSSTIQASTRHLIPPPDSDSAWVFKQKFSVLSPQQFAKLQFLSIRQKSKADDLLWYFSPALNRSIELTGSNRADFLMKTIFSLEDILFPGAKAENLEIMEIRTINRLLPQTLNSAITYQKSLQEKCDSFSGNIKNNNDYSGKTLLTRKDISVIDLKNLDPFSRVGRYRIYLAAEDLLPVMKEEFSHEGNLRKTALYSVIARGEFNIPVASMLLTGSNSLDAKRKTAFISTLNGRFCSEPPEDFKETELDPAHYWKH